MASQISNRKTHRLPAGLRLCPTNNRSPRHRPSLRLPRPSRNQIPRLFLPSPHYHRSRSPVCHHGGLTRFDPGTSTSLERGFTIAWLVVGQVAGAMMASSMKADKGNICERTCLFITFVIFFGPPTVG